MSSQSENTSDTAGATKSADQVAVASAPDGAVNGKEPQKSKIVKRFGGRHLIFRQKTGGFWLLPKPYLLISSFRGPVWVFYGAGQIWLTHKKEDRINNWMVRSPRFVSKSVRSILERIKPEVGKFIDYCNSQGLEGTLVIERKTLEFHWTFGNESIPDEKKKPENSRTLDSCFEDLVATYLKAKEDLGL